MRGAIYRRRVAACAELASRAATPTLKGEFLQLEIFWREMAEAVEAKERPAKPQPQPQLQVQVKA
jgi:hypothetical protein